VDNDTLEVKEVQKKEVVNEEEFLAWMLFDLGAPRWVWTPGADGAGSYSLVQPIPSYIHDLTPDCHFGGLR